MAPPTPTTTPMMVLRVVVDMPELPLLLACERPAVGVVTDTEVELLTEPSDAVTTTTAVEVTGVADVVVDDWSEAVVVLELLVEVGDVVIAPASVLLVVVVAAGAEVVV